MYKIDAIQADFLVNAYTCSQKTIHIWHSYYAYRNVFPRKNTEHPFFLIYALENSPKSAQSWREDLQGLPESLSLHF